MDEESTEKKPAPAPEEQFEIKKSKKERFTKVDFQSNTYEPYTEK